MQTSSLQSVYRKLHLTLNESVAVFNLIVVVCSSLAVAIVVFFELFEGMGFYLAMGFFALGLYFIYKKMMRDPLMLALDQYIKDVNQSGLTGDELLALKVLPTNGTLRRFNKYNTMLKDEGIKKLYQGLSHLSFSTEVNEIDENYRDAVKIIKEINRIRNQARG